MSGVSGKETEKKRESFSKCVRWGISEATYLDEKLSPTETLLHSGNRLCLLIAVKAYYWVKPIFHNSFDIENPAWTPIQSRDPETERCNFKRHERQSVCVAPGSDSAPLEQEKRNGSVCCTDPQRVKTHVETEEPIISNNLHQTDLSRFVPEVIYKL